MTKQEYLDQLMPYGDDCTCCGKKNHPYMVRNDLWDKVYPYAWRTEAELDAQTRQWTIHRRGFFSCLNCFERDLGRPLVESDFSPAPINHGMIFGFDCAVYCSLPESQSLEAVASRLVSNG